MEAWGWPARVTKLRFMALEMLIKRDDRNDLGINWVYNFYPVIKSWILCYVRYWTRKEL